MGGGLVVLGADGPSIAFHVDLAGSESDHRLDADAHAGLQMVAGVRAAEIGDVRALMHILADAMATKLAHYAIIELPHISLHRVPDVAHRIAGSGDSDSTDQGLFGAFQQEADFLFHLADGEGIAEVTMESVQKGPAIHGDDIAVLQHIALFGNAVYHDIVDGEAERSGETFVSLEGGDGVVVADARLAHLVEVQQGHARLYVLGHLGKRDGHHMGAPFSFSKSSSLLYLILRNIVIVDYPP